MKIFILILLSLVSATSLAQSEYTVVNCEWKHQKETAKIHNLSEIGKMIPNKSKCDLSSVDWKTQWVFFYKRKCSPWTDTLEVKDLTDGVLNITQKHKENANRQNPEIKCNLNDTCGKAGLAIILPAKAQIKDVVIHHEEVTCE